MFRQFQTWLVFQTLLLISVTPIISEDATSVSAYSVRGHVVDANDQPVSGVMVKLIERNDTLDTFRVKLDPAGQSIDKQYSLLETVTTDEQGQFRADIRTRSEGCFLLFDKAGSPSVTITQLLVPNAFVSHANPPIKVTLPTGKPTRVRVVDSSNQPLFGITVHRIGPIQSAAVSVNYYSWLDIGTQVGMTDVDGFITAELDPANGQYLWVDADGFFPQRVTIAPGKDPQLDPTAINSSIDQRVFGAEDPIVITLRKAARLDGRIVHRATQEPAEGVSVCVEKLNLVSGRYPGTVAHVNYEAATDSEGRFVFPELPDVPVRVIAWQGDQFGTHNGVELSADTPAQIKMELQKGTVIRGMVIDIDSSLPVFIEGARVELIANNVARFSGAISPDGSFEIYTPPETTGTLYLTKNPFWKIAPRDVQNDRIQERVLQVQRLPSPISDGEIVAELPKFPTDYSLSPHQVARRLTRPYPRSRDALFQYSRLVNFPDPVWIAMTPETSELLKSVRSPLPRYPSAMLWELDSNNNFHGREFQQSNIRTVVMNIFPSFSQRRLQYGLPWDRQDFIWTDLVVRENAPLVDLVRDLNAAWEASPRIPVRLSLSEEKFLTLVVRNSPDLQKLPQKFTLKSETAVPDKIPNITMYGRRWSEMVRIIGDELMGIEFLYEGTDDPKIPQLELDIPRVTFAFDTPVTQEAVAQRKAVIDQVFAELRHAAPQAFKEQLGVDVEICERVLPVLTIESAK